jgi:hypothetical protein
MSVFKDVIFDIQAEIRAGELSFAEIAERYDVPLDTVQAVFDDLCDEEFDDSMDGDFDSAMASAGLGTDEDYGYYGEEF